MTSANYPRGIASSVIKLVGSGLLGMMAFTAGLARADEVQLVTLDGTAVRADVSAIDSRGAISAKDGPLELHLDGLRSMIRNVQEAKPANPLVIIELAGGGRLNASGVTIGDEKCVVSWSFGEPLTLSIDAVRAVRLAPDQQLEAFQDDLANPPREFDRFYVKNEEQIQPVNGLIEKLTVDTVVFEWKGDRKTLLRKQLFGIVIADLGLPETANLNCRIHLRDGSQLAGGIQSLDSGTLHVTLGPDSNVAVPWTAVSRVDIQSSRMVFLSDLSPSSAQQQTLITASRPWQRDRSVAGRVLTLRYEAKDPQGIVERTYEKGLGTHAQCRLSYATAGKYDWFFAQVGIDAETEGRGDCIFVVLGDGEELCRHRVKGGEAPVDLRLRISGKQSVSLVVEPGEELDLADHVDWCDARFVRNAN